MLIVPARRRRAISPGTLGVGRLHVPGEPVAAVVGYPNGLVVVAVVSNHGQHRAEDLGLRKLGVLIDICDDRRHVPVPLAAAISSLTADDEPRPVGHRPLHKPLDSVELLSPDDRSHDVRRVMGIAPGHPLDHRRKAADDLVVHAA